MSEDGRSQAGAVCKDCRVFAGTGEGIVITDAGGDIVEVNPAYCTITGYRREDVLGKNPRIMKSDRHDADFYREMWRALLQEGQWQGEVWDRRRSGEVFPKWLTINALRDAHGGVTHYVGIFSDLTGAKRTEAELERLAHYDPVTGLPNRILFRDRLQQAAGQVGRGRRKLAVLFLDLDGFKAVNDGHGHSAGDLVLSAVGERLAAVLRSSDTVARPGGDEFTVLLPEVEGTGDAALVARKILDGLSEPFAVGASALRISASIGIAMYPDDAGSLDELLANADTAMYRAKESGRNGYQFYSRAMHARAVAQLELEAELRRAIDREEFVLHYQPQVDPRTGRMTGVEALVRWNHPRQGLIPPARFIPAAEETRLIVPLGEWVIRTACRQARAWLDAGLPPLRVAVNLAAAQFEDPKLVDRVAAWLIESRLDPADLEIEITESSAMARPDATIERLHEMKSIGLRVSIDDFGTGYSSLAYLRRFPVDALKIDRSFLRDIPDDQDNVTLCGAMIGLAHSLGLQVVGEGVETAAQLEFLRGRGCDLAQGYLFSRPLADEKLAALRRTGTPMIPASPEPSAPRHRLPSRRVRSTPPPPGGHKTPPGLKRRSTT